MLVKLHRLGSSDKRSQLYKVITDAPFSVNIFDLWLIENSGCDLIIRKPSLCMN